MSVFQLFFLCFLVGPLCYFFLWRALNAPRFLACCGLILTVASLSLPAVWAGVDTAAYATGLIMAGWVCCIASGAMLCAHLTSRKHLSRAIGALGVTLPWFGFAAAQAVSG